MIETEILSLLTKREFNKKLKEFTSQFGKPVFQKRASISLSSYETQIDTRIKITNGKVHIVQKTGGEFSNLLQRQEINIDLNLDIDNLLSLVRMIQNIGKNQKGFTSHLQQFENSLFKIPKGEIKMYHQFGKTDLYGFELEVEEDVDIYKKMKELGLKLDGIPRTHKYWRNYDKTVNFDCLMMSDKKMKSILEKYL